MTDEKKLSPVEATKEASKGLRGTLDKSIVNRITGALAAQDQQLIKFHGVYQQDNRDRREERAQKKLEPAYSFMVRLRMPGGDCTLDQWQGIQRIADQYGTGVVKITTRQTIQIHGVVKSKLRPSIKDFNALGLDSIAACGDVNRNVIATSNPALAPWHNQVHQFAAKISKHLLPKTYAYYEIFVGGESLNPKPEEEDKLYQNRYLPRKFKIALAIPPENECDVFAQDIGLISIEKDGELEGFNVSIGGGLGATHGNAATYPRLGSIIGFAKPEQVLDLCWQIVAVQRDFGNRDDRKQARLKYTIDRLGLDKFCTELYSRTGFTLDKARDFTFTTRADNCGWIMDHNGIWHYTIFVENGLIVDGPQAKITSFLKEFTKIGTGSLRFSANQNVILLGITNQKKTEIDKLLESHGLLASEKAASVTRKAALACVALPTCPLALAEAQRYLPKLITKIEALLEKHGLLKEEISIRMTGCPNGCARPYLAEIGLIGTAPDQYNLHLGGDHVGQRLNQLYKSSLHETEILETLNALFSDYVQKRTVGERFGDFIQRTGEFSKSVQV